MGTVTDRGLVVEVLAEDVELEAVAVGDLMRTDPAQAREQDDLWDALGRMRRLGVRPKPVFEAQGALAGILAVDDFIDLMAKGLQSVA